MVLDRSDALIARLRTGGWACVLVERESADVGLPNAGFEGARTTGVRYLRLLCPIAEGSR